MPVRADRCATYISVSSEHFARYLREGDANGPGLREFCFPLRDTSWNFQGFRFTLLGLKSAYTRSMRAVL